MAHKAMNSRVDPEVICGPLSLKASSTGRDGSSTVGSTRPSWRALTRASRPSRASASVRVSVMLVSCWDSVEPAAEADQRAGGAEDVPDAVQQPAPAAQRPRVAQMPDGLLHQCPQPRLLPVVGPLRVGELVFGAAVADRRVPVLPRFGQATEAAVHKACDLDPVQRVV